MNSERQPSSSEPYDPVFFHARREALVILLGWVSCFVWSVTYCALFGYGTTGAGVETLVGIPTWVVWGIVAPWLVADVFAVWFCFLYVADDDLGEVCEDLGLEEEQPGRNPSDVERPDA